MVLAPLKILHCDRSATVLESLRSLTFQGDYSRALELYTAHSNPNPQLETWAGILYTFQGDTARATHILTSAVARGYQGALGPLAYLHRIAKQPRPYLEAITPEDTATLDPFEAALLERETGEWHLELERYPVALDWLERAWTTAQIGPYGDQQLSSIALPFAATLARLGFDARAVSVLDEGLRRCNHRRRVPLLYERGMRNLALGRLEAVEDDLAELEGFVPEGNAELPLLVKYLNARYLHALGAVAEARAAFALVFTFASNASGGAISEIALHAALWASALEVESDGNPQVWLERADGLAINRRARAWLLLRRGRWLSNAGRHLEAEQTLAQAVGIFEALEARVELALALLHRADALLREGIDREDEVGSELLHAAQIAEEIGGAAPFALELRNLLAVRSYLSRSHVLPVLKALLEPSHSYQRLTVRDGRLEINRVRRVLSADTAQLVAYLHRHPMSSWTHLRSNLYADLDDSSAKAAFERARATLEDIADLHVTYNARGHAYSLCWLGVTLELVSGPSPLTRA
jgi:tetratricopeptide (TPR) repeat protein